MRLRQLSRKLDIDTEKIIHYLKACNLPCEDDSNAKLSSEQVEVLISKFGSIDEVIETESKIEPVEEVEEVVKETVAVETIIAEEDSETSHAQLSEVISSLQQNQEEPTAEPEVIRAPKVELTGLKVVGKIELRTPKKKEDSEEEEEVTLEEKNELPKVNKVRSNYGRNKQRNQPQKKTLSIAEERKREEKRKHRRKKEAEQLAKEKRRENYLKKVKSKDKIEGKKIIVEKTNRTSQPKPTRNVGLFTKFFNWMRRE